MPYINTAKFRQHHPASWNEVWRIIKADKPDYADFLSNPFFKVCIESFDSSIDLRIEDLPARALPLIPPELITQ